MHSKSSAATKMVPFSYRRGTLAIVHFGWQPGISPNCSMFELGIPLFPYMWAIISALYASSFLLCELSFPCHETMSFLFSFVQGVFGPSHKAGVLKQKRKKSQSKLARSLALSLSLSLADT